MNVLNISDFFLVFVLLCFALGIVSYLLGSVSVIISLFHCKYKKKKFSFVISCIQEKH